MRNVSQPVAGLAGVVLAAGGSSRLGQPKQLLDYAGQPLVKHAVDAARVLCGSGVLVITGASQRAVSAAVTGSASRVVHNPAWAQGMAGSITQAVAALDAADCEAMLLLVCDQPKVTAAHLARLVALWQKSPTRPAAAFYNDAVGVPAIFPRSWFDRLAGLQGDSGARLLLRDHAQVQRLDLPEAALDIDVPDDLMHLAQANDRL